MTESAFHRALVWAVFATAALTFMLLLRLTAPYGRHYSGRGWGPEMANRAGWIVMELPATVLFGLSSSWETPRASRFRSFCWASGSATT